MSENSTQTVTLPENSDQIIVDATAKKPITLRKAALSLIPFTPVSFKNNEAFFAWLRLVGYGAASAYLFTKPSTRKVAYFFAGATIVSASTSLASDAWNKE